MNVQRVEEIANAVLYEGYILYPYRASAVKNRQRFNFGVVYPRAYSETQGGPDAWSMQTECVALGGPDTTVDAKVRFLHLVTRTAGELAEPVLELREGDITKDREPEFRAVATLEAGGRIFPSWQEAVEREVSVTACNLAAAAREPRRQVFLLPSSRTIEAVRDSSGQIVGILVRAQQSIQGVVEVAAEPRGDGAFAVAVRTWNFTSMAGADPASRDEALTRSLASTHTILSVRGGEFVSLLDPPEPLRGVVEGCRNTGTWPVLVGDEGQRDAVLSSPIILYDYPQIAAESPGDLFDGTEIDEILALRILTMTEEEKREMRQTDERARRILERTETLSPQRLMKLHGAMRGLRRLDEDGP